MICIRIFPYALCLFASLMEVPHFSFSCIIIITCYRRYHRFRRIIAIIAIIAFICYHRYRRYRIAFIVVGLYSTTIIS